MNAEYNKLSKEQEQVLLSDDVHIHDLVGEKLARNTFSFARETREGMFGSLWTKSP